MKICQLSFVISHPLLHFLTRFQPPVSPFQHNSVILWLNMFSRCVDTNSLCNEIKIV